MSVTFYDPSWVKVILAGEEVENITDLTISPDNQNILGGEQEDVIYLSVPVSDYKTLALIDGSCTIAYCNNGGGVPLEDTSLETTPYLYNNAWCSREGVKSFDIQEGIVKLVFKVKPSKPKRPRCPLWKW